MNKTEMENIIAQSLCNKEETFSCNECLANKRCKYDSGICRIGEKTVQQLEYILSPIDKNIYLEACPGSGKTEVVGMKAAYEISRWNQKGGIAILSFTNDSTNVIKTRVDDYSLNTSIFPHFIGTIDSFIHEYIVQPFGYKVAEYTSDDNDNSFRLIDKKSNKDNYWLQKYKFKFSKKTADNGQIPYFANNLLYNLKDKKWFLYSGYNSFISLENLYFSNNFFSYQFRELYKNETSYKSLENHAIDVKKKFFKDGFATFEDIDIIALWVLNNLKKVTKIISNRFPLIIVDECQDLSYSQIKILQLLENSGSKLHFVGDLNQSIYEFKGVDIEDIKKAIELFLKMKLNTNFRSCQPIVNFSSKLINSYAIFGKSENLYGEDSLLYLENNDPTIIIKDYVKILEEFKINESETSILVKQNALRKKILNIADDKKHLLLCSLIYWKYGNVEQKKEALNLIGKQICKWFKYSGNSRNYFCPEAVTSIFEWRMFLKSVLNECFKNERIMNFEVNYKQWYKTIRNEMPSIINSYLYKIIPCCKDRDNLKKFENEKFKYNTPSGEGTLIVKEQVDLIMKNTQSHLLKVETIHKSKGKTYDSNLVISSQKDTAESAYWKQWISNGSESSRIGYVASTRAKYLLVWGVPKLSNDDRIILEELGFKNGKEILSSGK